MILNLRHNKFSAIKKKKKCQIEKGRKEMPQIKSDDLWVTG